MTDDHAQLITPTILMIERVLPGTRDRVWAYLVEPELRQQWFAGGPLEQKAGGALRLDFDHRRISDQPTPDKYKDDEVTEMAGTVLECDPPRLLAFTWNEHGTHEHDGKVTITLTQEGDTVRLRLVHERLEGLETQIGVCAGWHSHLDLLVDLTEARPARDFWLHHMPLEDVYRARLTEAG